MIVARCYVVLLVVGCCGDCLVATLDCLVTGWLLGLLLW